jgi:arginine decarboxylase
MRTRLKQKETPSPRSFTIQDAMELYTIPQWGLGYFGINDKGHLVIRPTRDASRELDIMELVIQLVDRGIAPPILLRFTDVLRHRLEELHRCFEIAIADHHYPGIYRGVYPIKVNQARQVVEDLLEFGRPYHYGLEAGSKPELLVALALLDDPEALLICNGYKDAEFVDAALLGSKLGKKVILVIEKLSELEMIIARSRALGVRPTVGIRAKLAARGSGRWEASAGDTSKFGLFVSEILAAVATLRKEEMLDCFKLLHFHLGSQISSIRSIQEALRESCQIYAELCKMGCPLEFFDVGGGLAVDYDGSKTNFPSSANYGPMEYAADIVDALSQLREKTGVAAPTIISESGRAVVAHHSLLICEVLGTTMFQAETTDLEPDEEMPDVLYNLAEVNKNFTMKSFQEAFHDAVHYKEEALSLFKLGYLSLEDRARVENVFYLICQKILKVIRELDYVPDEFENLERFMAATYYCNFSVFQSAPDHWAVKQLFPVLPIHRLDERPSCQAILADVTCDSDGKMDQFIDLRDVKSTLSLHPYRPPYYLAICLLGAYQEVLGDLHNLFGDTNIVHISLTRSGSYRIDRYIAGDTISEVVGYVQYSPKRLLSRMRAAVEAGVESGKFTPKQSRDFLASYTEALRAYTYLVSGER